MGYLVVVTFFECRLSLGGNEHEVSLLLDTVRTSHTYELIGDSRQRARDGARSRFGREVD